MTDSLSNQSKPTIVSGNSSSRDLLWLGDIGREIITQTIKTKVGDSYFVLEQLEDNVLVAIIKSICSDTDLAKRIVFRIPKDLNLPREDLPEGIWFSGDAGSARLSLFQRIKT